ncbi:hypothetical protein [Pseudomonas sp. RIT-PI-r]|uniref:hypothetical protein n=1 Tax=Pseudomonas sp. RIT-PI-r TaxID=1699620 RepID=UPI0006D6A8AF|nr:hypothetical protein [Pseudomonas sp. RIT-PI-r]KPG97954.1 hypothetical protein AK821_09295 [Pseudomonas sp. RIT-PI-r]
MCTLTHFALPADARVKSPLVLHVNGMAELSSVGQYAHTPRFQVIPAGNAFFHIREKSTGLVRGFREDHNEACALARSLESQIELRASDCLR